MMRGTARSRTSSFFKEPRAQGGEDYVRTFDGLANGCGVERVALDGMHLVAQREFFWCPKEGRDTVTGGEAAFREESSRGSAGSEDGDVHGGPFLLVD